MKAERQIDRKTERQKDRKIETQNQKTIKEKKCIFSLFPDSY